MTIKIPPYPNFIIKDETFAKSNVPIVKKTSSEGLEKQLIMMVEFKPGEKRVLRTRAIKHNGNFYISALPNPIHLFLTLSVEHFETSEEIKEMKFKLCGKKMGDDIYMLDIEESGTHQCYNDYIKYRSSSIIMLVSSIEAFINHAIPNDFTFQKGNKCYSKIEIEGPKVQFAEKLELIIPQLVDDQSFWEINCEIKLAIELLYKIRKNLIHLKTNADNDFNAYFTAIDEMLELDIGNCIDSTVNFFNAVKPNFIEFN